jgi:hypothetical protein
VRGSLLEAGWVYASEDDVRRLQEMLDRTLDRANPPLV